jgi:hypothetical protein
VTEPRESFPSRVVAWLRAGYPAGVPRQDYVALLGILQRKLTDAEVHQIARDLADQAESGTPITPDDIEKMINEATLQHTSDEEIARVSARLAAGGWPLSDPPPGD